MTKVTTDQLVEDFSKTELSDLAAEAGLDLPSRATKFGIATALLEDDPEFYPYEEDQEPSASDETEDAPEVADEPDPPSPTDDEDDDDEEEEEDDEEDPIAAPAGQVFSDAPALLAATGGTKTQRKKGRTPRGTPKPALQSQIHFSADTVLKAKGKRKG